MDYESLIKRKVLEHTGDFERFFTEAGYVVHSNGRVITATLESKKVVLSYEDPAEPLIHPLIPYDLRIGKPPSEVHYWIKFLKSEKLSLQNANNPKILGEFTTMHELLSSIFHQEH